MNRSIDRLKEFLSHKSIEELLPAISYNVNHLPMQNILMIKYLKREENELKKGYYLLLYMKVVD